MMRTYLIEGNLSTFECTHFWYMTDSVAFLNCVGRAGVCVGGGAMPYVVCYLSRNGVNKAM